MLNAQHIPLLVTQKALEGGAPLGAFAARQVQGMLEAGVTWSQLPQDLRVDHALAYYCGQVHNGGHSQFIENARNWYDAGPEQMLRWAAEAAHAYRLHDTEVVILGALNWLLSHPKEALRLPVDEGEAIPKALDRLDVALYAADCVDEAAWWAEAKRLDAVWLAGERLAAEKNRPSFPMPVVYLRQAAMLLGRPHQIVAPAEFDNALAAMTEQIEGVADERLRRMFRAMAETRPGPVTCAVSVALTERELWPSDKALLREMSVVRGRDRSVVRLEMQDSGKNTWLHAEVAQGHVTLFVARHTFSRKPAWRFRRGLLGLLARWIGARGQAWADQPLTSNVSIRRAEKIAEGQLVIGQEAFDLCDRMHVPEALAVHLAAHKVSSTVRWRLLRSRQDGELAQDWLIDAMGGRKFEVLGRADKVMIREAGSDEITSYPLAELSVVRKRLKQGL